MPDTSTTIRETLFEQGPPTGVQQRLSLPTDQPLNLKRRAALAARVGIEFERTWLTRDAPTQDALSKPDFSATTDLYGIVANVHAMRLAPIDRQSVIVIAFAALLPFVPVVLLAVPLNAIWSNIRALLF